MTDPDIDKAAKEAAAFKTIERSFESLMKAYGPKGVATHRITPKGETLEDTPKVSNGGGFV